MKTQLSDSHTNSNSAQTATDIQDKLSAFLKRPIAQAASGLTKSALESILTKQTPTTEEENSIT